MGLTPLQHLTEHLDPWLDESLDERQAITQLHDDVKALVPTIDDEPPNPDVDPERVRTAARLVISLGNHVWLWKDWPDYIAAAHSRLDRLEALVPPGTKGWGRWSR